MSKRVCPVLFLMLAVTVFIAACGPNLPQEEAAAPASFATPQPATSPTTLPSPVATVTAGPTATPQPTPTPHIVPLVDIGSMETYEHTRRLFAVDVPQSWEAVEEQSDNASHVTFTSPFESARMHITVLDTEQAPAAEVEFLEDLNLEDMEETLRNAIESQFADAEGLEVGAAEPQPDGSIRIAFTLDATVNAIPTTLIGNSFIQHDHNLVTLMWVTVPREQFVALQPALDHITNSFAIDEDAATYNQPAIVRLDPLQTYTHPANLFSIDVPSLWDVTDQSGYVATEIAFRDRDETGTIIVNISDAQGVLESAELGGLLQEKIETDYGETIYRFNAMVNPPEQQSDGSMRVTFTYDTMIRGVQTTMLGNSFIQRQGAVDIILISIVPQQQFGLLNEALNSIINSFQLGAPLTTQ